MRRALLVDAPKLPAYDLGRGHPFAPFRQLPLFDLLDRHGLVAADQRFVPEPLSEDRLLTVHAPAYVELLRRLDDPTDREALRIAPVFGMGTGDNPIQPGQHASAAAAAGGTVACVEAVVDGRADATFNTTGGLHHAMPDAASGFCLYNDLSLGIVEARRRGVARVAYLDFDVHHGDGVERVFREDPSVLTISFHEDPEVRFPFTGRVADRGKGAGIGSAINVPFASGTGDASWQDVVERVVRPALERFGPDLLVTQHGCDTHVTDPLADLSLSTASASFAARLARELADAHCGGRWVATGGGGYRPFTVIPRAWAMVWCAVADRDLPTATGPDWRARWREEAGEPLPETFVDPPFADPRADRAAEINARTLEEVLGVHGL